MSSKGLTVENTPQEPFVSNSALLAEMRAGRVEMAAELKRMSKASSEGLKEVQGTCTELRGYIQQLQGSVRQLQGAVDQLMNRSGETRMMVSKQQ